MSPDLALLLVTLGFGGSFLAGLVGIGGAIVMIPLLLYVPPILGFATLGIRTVAGITIVQVVAGSLAGLAGHARSGAVDRGLVLWLGGSMVVGSAAGAIASASVPARALEIVFATVALAAAALTLARRDHLPAEDATRTAPPRLLTVAIGGGVGTIAGMLGAGGAFLLVPLMLHVLRIPMRTVVGSSLGIVVVSSIAGLAGKALTGQVDWSLAVFLVLGAVPGGLLGARVSRRTRPRRLALILGVAIALVALRMWADVLFGAKV
jgi:hypothetical protein